MIYLKLYYLDFNNSKKCIHFYYIDEYFIIFVKIIRII